MTHARPSVRSFLVATFAALALAVATILSIGVGTSADEAGGSWHRQGNSQQAGGSWHRQGNTTLAGGSWHVKTQYGGSWH